MLPSYRFFCMGNERGGSMKKIAVLALLFLLLAGCAANRQFEEFANEADDTRLLISVLGPPSHTAAMPDGTTLYVWSTSRNVSMGGLPVYQPNNQVQTGTVYSATGRLVGTYSGTSTGGGSVTFTPVYNVEMGCEMRVIAGADGRIVNRVYRGNDCDSLIVNPGAIPVKKPVKAMNYKRPEECLEEAAGYYASVDDTMKPEDLVDITERECALHFRGGTVPSNMALHYANKALKVEQ